MFTSVLFHLSFPQIDPKVAFPRRAQPKVSAPWRDKQATGAVIMSCVTPHHSAMVDWD